uniref:Scaffolding anchor of CK1 domain-containing protein n=1 Tax=Chelonoidis abingdonii TaxID=106734 RepID=A0A8C0GVA5_CHEAB
MAASQLDCLEDAPAGTPVTESSPEFFYSEGQRLAVEALLAGGQSAYVQCLAQDRLRPFLSNDELRHLAEAAQDVPEPAGECEGDADELSLSYWPGCSDEPIPELELGWPLDGNWKGITRAEVYTHPPGDGAPKVKELVRRKIQQAAKVVAIVMDVFTDPDILLDLHEAGTQRGVPVYLILGEEHLAAFLSTAEGACLNVRYMENLRVRVIAGCTFRSRQRKQITGTLKEKFLLIDGDTVITGSYSSGPYAASRRCRRRTPAQPRPPATAAPAARLPAANGGLQAGQSATGWPSAARVRPQHVAGRAATLVQLVARVVRPRRAMNLPGVLGPEGHSALSDVDRGSRPGRLAGAVGQRPSKSLWDLSRLSQLSGSSTGRDGPESGDEAKVSGQGQAREGAASPRGQGWGFGGVHCVSWEAGLGIRGPCVSWRGRTLGYGSLLYILGVKGLACGVPCDPRGQGWGLEPLYPGSQDWRFFWGEFTVYPGEQG